MQFVRVQVFGSHTNELCNYITRKITADEIEVMELNELKYIDTNH